MIDPLYSLSGFAVGMLVGMTGVGGGALMTPILILLFGVHPATAVGTDLLYAAATKTGGSLVHGFARSIDWRVVRRLAGGSIPATVVTLAALSHFNLNGEAARSLITLVLSFALFLTAFVLVFGGAIVAVYRARVAEIDAKRTAIDTVLVGALLGVLVTVSSVGAGAIGVIALVLLYPHLPMAKVVGSDIAHAVPLTLIGPRPLDDGLGRLAHHQLAAGRLAAGYLHWQLFRHPHPGTCLEGGAGDDPDRGCKQDCLRSCQRGLVDFHRLHARRGALSGSGRIRSGAARPDNFV